MYDNIAVEIEETKIAVMLLDVVWIIKNSVVFEESEAFSYKIAHIIIKPRYIIIADKVGRNISLRLD